MSEIDLMAELDDPCPRGCGRSSDECDEAEDGEDCYGSPLVRELERQMEERARRIESRDNTIEQLRAELAQVRGDHERMVAVHTDAYAEMSTANANLIRNAETLAEEVLQASIELDRLRGELARVGMLHAQAAGELTALKPELASMTAQRDSARDADDAGKRYIAVLEPVAEAAKEVVYCWKSGRLDHYVGIAENKLAAAVDALGVPEAPPPGQAPDGEEAWPLSVSCPACGAPERVWCYDANSGGHTIGHVHQLRRERADSRAGQAGEEVAG